MLDHGPDIGYIGHDSRYPDISYKYSGIGFTETTENLWDFLFRYVLSAFVAKFQPVEFNGKLFTGHFVSGHVNPPEETL